ncbi:MAG: hypothetical protein KGD60_08015 [Candidatus Thorarchaeota archaeon]|nr:hypothetical protein [Candidatus Thorarchaeota archaeon]
MSGKPTGVLLLAVLQLIAALLYIAAGGILVMAALALGGLFAILIAFPALIIFIVGIIGLILFYGLYALKGWAWFWALIINLLGIVGGVLRFETLLTDYLGLGGFAVSVIIVIYLLMPSTKAHFR